MENEDIAKINVVQFFFGKQDRKTILWLMSLCRRLDFSRVTVTGMQIKG